MMDRAAKVRFFTGLIIILGLTACASRAGFYPVSAPQVVNRAKIHLPTIAFTIQVGAFSTPSRAARYAEGLHSRGLDAYYFIDSDHLYKVRFERFQTRAAAQARAAEVKDWGYIQDFFIVQPPAVAHGVDSDNALRSGIVRTARRFIGTPYRWGGESARSGFDCSGLTMTVYRLNGLDLPRTSRSQFRAGKHTPRQALRAGDLVFFSTGNKKQVSHVGIFSGKGQFIHASGKGRKIQTASLNNRYFQTRYMGARRYF